MTFCADRAALWLALLLSPPVGLYSLKAATIRVFDERVAQVETRNQARLTSGPFLWVDELNQPEKQEAYARLKNGDVEIRRIKDSSDPDVPDGIIHDWQGIVFIPGVKLDDVLRVLQDYDHHATYYAPNVDRAKIESRNGDHFKVFMRFRQRKVVTVVLDTEQDIHYFRDSATRAHSRSSATRVAQVDNPGTAKEQEKKPGEDDGYMWRMETWWRMEERDGGVYVQNEAVSLTRDIPMGLGWLVEPFVTNIPRETLDFTLAATRKTVLEKAEK